MEFTNINESFESIMIIVPHQDDELLMSAGIIKQSILENKKVTVVMVTNGDYGAEDYNIGRARLRETLSGLSTLGLTKENIVFLGYADTGMPEENSFIGNLYNKENEDEVVQSHCSNKTYGLEEKVDFHTERFGVAAFYTRKNLYDDLKTVLDEYNPEAIFTTSEYDFHGDHKYLYLFLIDILNELRKGRGYNPVLFTGIVHSCAGDDKWPVREEEIKEFTCPELLEESTDLKWKDRVSHRVPESMMDINRDRNLKYQAIAKHVTALKPDAVDYLFSFVKANEVFWKVNW